MTEVKSKTGRRLLTIIIVIAVVLILIGIGGKLVLRNTAEKAAVSVVNELFGEDTEDESSEDQQTQNISPPTKITPTSVTKASTPKVRTILLDTKWRYMIQVGGGIGGVMRFEKDEREFVSGIYEENGPEGKEEKKFDGVWDRDTLILQMGDFPRFKVIISADGKIMQGKPLEENKDIFYPDDFFKATLEN